MKQSELEMLRAQAAKVELPQSVREAVVAEATALDQAEQSSTAGRGLTRRSFLRVGAAAAAVGVTAFLGLSIFGKDNTLAVFGDDDSQKQGFVLTAFADEYIPADGKTFPVQNYAGDFGQGPSDIDGMYDVTYRLSVYGKIIGAGTGTITRTLEGPYTDNATGITGNEPTILLCNDITSDLSPEDPGYFADSVTSTFATAGGSPFAAGMTITAHFPMSDALRTAIENGDRRAQLLEARHCFNKLLAETTLRIALTYNYDGIGSGIIPEYEDGTTFESSFVIAPTANFDETCSAYLDEMLSWEEKGHVIAEARTLRGAEYDFDFSHMTSEDFQFNDAVQKMDEKYWFYTIREIDG